MNSPNLIFVTGPSGVGKSTTAEEVAAQWPSTCAMLSFDQIRGFIKSGYAEPAIDWNEETARQWQLTKHVAITMASTYIRDGVSVVLEAFATPQDFPEWKRLFGSLPYKAVALLPHIGVAQARNNQREGVRKLKESDVTRNYEWSIGWPDVPGIAVLDNSARSVADTAREILKISTS